MDVLSENYSRQEQRAGSDRQAETGGGTEVFLHQRECDTMDHIKAPWMWTCSSFASDFGQITEKTWLDVTENKDDPDDWSSLFKPSTFQSAHSWCVHWSRKPAHQLNSCWRARLNTTKRWQTPRRIKLVDKRFHLPGEEMEPGVRFWDRGEEAEYFPKVLP